MIAHRSTGAAIALIVMAAATAAQAQDPSKATLVLKPYATTAQKTVPMAATPRADMFAQSNALRAAGIARTSVDRLFADDEAVGSVGFLCGLQPSHNNSGGASAYGSDPQGRFLGAKLSRAF